MQGSKSKTKLLVAMTVGFSALAFSVGLLIAHKTSPTREPSSHTKGFLSSTDRDLQLLSQRQLLSGAKVIQSNGHLGVELGGFYVRSASGEKNLACEVFERIDLVFVAEGMAVSGELPQMKVSGLCRHRPDSEVIQALIVNKSRVLRSPATDQKIHQEEENIEVAFSHVSDSWPQAWALYSIRFHNSDGRELKISPEEIRSSRAQPLVLEW